MRMQIHHSFGAVLAAWGLANPAFAQNELTIEQSVQIALSANDPSVQLLEERALALEERAISDSQLPDPIFSTQIKSIPLSSFDLNAEGMTQLAFGVRQAFPKGNSRSITRKKRLDEALAQRQQKSLRNREIALQTRTFWLELLYWQQAKEITEQTKTKIMELAEISTTNYANGRSSVQNVLRIDLEKALLDTRLIELDRKADMARANLTRMIGIANAARPLSATLPILVQTPNAAMLHDGLSRHPSVLMFDAKISARERDVDLARQQYKPGFAASANLGLRDGRSSFGSIGVSYSIPLFTKNRQDRVLSGRKHMRSAAQLGRDAQLLELNRKLGIGFASWSRLGERITAYEKTVIPQANETAKAALNAYQNDVADFAELVRAELAVLNIHLTLTRLRTDRAKARAGLLFLEGEKS